MIGWMTKILMAELDIITRMPPEETVEEIRATYDKCYYIYVSTFRLRGYRNMVKMSKFKYILVEGRDYKIALLDSGYELFGDVLDLRVHGAYQIQFGSESVV